jgi:hypothetical protein
MDAAQSADRLPAGAAWLGYGGLVPFVVPALAPLWDHHHGAVWGDVLFAYAAVILAFVGALHWGFAISLAGLTAQRRQALFAWSVVPALLAWPALLLSPALASPLLIGGFLLHYIQDRRLARVAQLPHWYLPLRRNLTLVACFCLAAGAWSSGPTAVPLRAMGVAA